MDKLGDYVDSYADHPTFDGVLILLGTAVLVILVRLSLIPLLRRLTRRTASEVDDRIIDRLSPALIMSLVLIGLHWAIVNLIPTTNLDQHIISVLATLLVLIWARFFMFAGTLLFNRLGDNVDRFQWIQPQTLPFFQFVYKFFLIGAVTYLLLSAWKVNLTSWLASAGVMGIAIGFAAKDTLANFISGIFILMDAPYKVGDVINIDDTTRGIVREIGMRSTRLLTLDNIEVTVPNAVIGNAKIINESSGPDLSMRVRAHVSVAYGSDVDQVREILARCAQELDHVTAVAPVVRFEAMADSGLDFTVRVMAVHPRWRGRVRDDLNTRIYKALGAAGVEIPFPQRDLHVKTWPGAPMEKPGNLDG